MIESPNLNIKERARWIALRSDVAGGVEQTFDMMSKLLDIRDNRLYREDYPSFAAYVETELGTSRKNIDRGIMLYQARERVAAICSQPERVNEFINQTQAELLHTLPDAEFAAVVKDSVKIAGSKPVTAKIIKQAIASSTRPTAAPSSSIVKDDVGDDVPPGLRRSHAMAAIFQQVARKLQPIMTEITKLASEPGGEYLQATVLHENLNRVSRAIVQSGYAMTCVACGGDKCESCRHSGFIPKRDMQQ